MIVCFSTCLDSIRPLPAMQHDQARPEDMDSNLEDHAADEWRYACMSRPWVKTVKEKRPERNNDGYERAVRESDGYRTICKAPSGLTHGATNANWSPYRGKRTGTDP